MTFDIAFFKKTFKSLVLHLKGSHQGIEDVIVSLFPQLVSLIIGLLTSILIARGLGTKGMGDYALIVSISTLASSLSDLGISRATLRFSSMAVAEGDTETQYSILRWAFRLKMTFTIVITLVIFIITPVIANDLWNAGYLIPLMWLILLTGIFNTLATVPAVYFQSLKRFKTNTIISVAMTLITFSGILVLAVFNLWSLSNVVIVSLIDNIVGAIVLLILIPKASIFSLLEFKDIVKNKFKNYLKEPDIRHLKSIDATNPGKFAVFMIVTSLAALITTKSDIWLMGVFLNKSQIGLYSVATYFVIPFSTLTYAVNTVLWPRVSALKSVGQTKKLLMKMMTYCMIITLAGVMYSIFVPYIIPYTFGSSYSGGILLAQVLCLGYCLTIIMCPLQVLGMNFGFINDYWWINIIQMIAVVTIDVVLLPVIGPLAAAISIVVNYGIGLSLSSIMIWSKMRGLEIKTYEYIRS